MKFKIIYLMLFPFFIGLIGCKTVEKEAKGVLFLKENGFLLVRLNTFLLPEERERFKEVHWQYGNHWIKMKENTVQNIIKGFEEEFNFCPVYYFYATETKQVKAKNLEGVVLNNLLNPVEISELDGKSFLIIDTMDINLELKDSQLRPIWRLGISNYLSLKATKDAVRELNNKLVRYYKKGLS